MRGSQIQTADSNHNSNFSNFFKVCSDRENILLRDLGIDSNMKRSSRSQTVSSKENCAPKSEGPNTCDVTRTAKTEGKHGHSSVLVNEFDDPVRNIQALVSTRLSFHFKFKSI